jgi:hypothetical protein
MRLFRAALWLVIVTVFVPVAASAQTASIRGTVADRQGGVVVGATVVLTGETGPMLETSTSAQGAFEFAAVRPGQHTLVVSAPGFAAWSQVVRLTGSAAGLMVTLDVAGISETVGVVGTGVSTISV